MDTTKAEYGVVEHATTGEVWAIKRVNGHICGVHRYREKAPPTRKWLPTLTYEVGAELAFFKARFQEFTIYPWLKD